VLVCLHREVELNARRSLDMWNKKSGTEENTAISPFREIPGLDRFPLQSP